MRSKPPKPSARQADSRTGSAAKQPLGLRIIGGRFRGRRLLYGGDPRVRPMKDRVREAIFNLIGTDLQGKLAVDLFAGTGALGLEAVSRGAARAVMIEQHFPTAAIIRQNVAALGAEDLVEIVTSNVFIWQQREPDLGPLPRVVFCSPPYEFYVSRTEEVLRLIGGLLESAPAGSVFVVESDDRFDFGLLPDAATWDLRQYPPAMVGLYR